MDGCENFINFQGYVYAVCMLIEWDADDQTDGQLRGSIDR